MSPETFHVPSQDGVQVAVHDYGGPGMPMVFVHGTGLCSRMWEPVIERLPLDRIRPLGVDLRGHGSTSTPSDVRFFDHRMVADLCAVIDHVGIKDGAVAAHSMGAATSMLATLARPSAFGRVWAYEPIIFPTDGPHSEGLAQMVAATRKRRRDFPNRQTVIDRYGSRFPLDELDPACLATYVQHGFTDQEDGSVRLACDPELEARAFEDFLQDGWGRLADMTTPVRVAYGGRMLDRAGELAPRVAEQLPNHSVDCFESSAHFGPFGELDHAARSITQWCIDRIGL